MDGEPGDRGERLPRLLPPPRRRAAQTPVTRPCPDPAHRGSEAPPREGLVLRAVGQGRVPVLLGVLGQLHTRHRRLLADARQQGVRRRDWADLIFLTRS